MSQVSLSVDLKVACLPFYALLNDYVISTRDYVCKKINQLWDKIPSKVNLETDKTRRLF